MKKTLNTNQCYVCGSYKIKTLKDPKNFIHLICKNCQLSQLHPQHLISSTDLYTDDYFDGTMFQKTGGQFGYPVSYSDISKSHRLKHYKKYIRELNHLFSSNDLGHLKVLDFGCGYGNFLQILKREVKNMEVHGIEVNKEVCEKASSNLGGAPVYCVDLKSDTEGVVPRNYFDAITLLDVIEHLDDPRAYLKVLAQCAKAKSYLLLSTPNIESLNAKLYGSRWILHSPPYHIHYFGPKSMRILLSQTGWKMKYFFTECTIFHNEKSVLKTWRGRLLEFVFGNFLCDVFTNHIFKIGSILVVVAQKS